MQYPIPVRDFMSLTSVFAFMTEKEHPAQCRGGSKVLP